MSRPRLLVTGASGFLGAAVMRQAGARFDVLGTYLTRACAGAVALDIRDDDAVRRLCREFQPQAIVHTAYEKSSTDVIIAGSARIAEAAARHGARLAHLSTDVIFDGKRGRYGENDAPAPLLPYGAAKLAAEGAVRAACPAAVLVRTSLIYGRDGTDASSRMVLEGARAGRPVNLFADEWRSPVLVDELAAALLDLAALDVRGPLHVAGSERINRYDFGVLLARFHSAPQDTLVATTTEAAGMLRPKDCSLDSARAERLLGRRLRGAREVLAR